MSSLIQKFLSRKGQFAGLSWMRPVKTRKGFRHLHVTKSVRCVAQVGVNYSNRATVKEARENGQLPATPQPLPWGVWKEFPFIIEHKGKDYLRIYPVSGRVPRVIYRCNGKLVSRKFAQRVCLASEFSDKSEPFICFTVGAENITAIR